MKTACTRVLSVLILLPVLAIMTTGCKASTAPVTLSSSTASPAIPATSPTTETTPPVSTLPSSFPAQVSTITQTAATTQMPTTAYTPTTSPVTTPATTSPSLPAPGTPGPWDQDVLVYQISASGTVTKTGTFERAGVPTIARMKDGRLIAAHQYFPATDPESFDKVAVRFSSDDGYTWTNPQVIRLVGLPEGMRFPFDPTLVVLPDGKIRLYFTGQQSNEATLAIYSAISTNGINYTFEPGTRFGIPGRRVIDCAVVLHQGVFHLYSPDNGAQDPPDKNQQSNGYHATSQDGLNFTRIEDVKIDDTRNWLGNAQSDGRVITFWGTFQRTSTPAGGNAQQGLGIWRATSPDGKSWNVLESLPIIGVVDPGVVVSLKGGWIVVATGPPRPGTPSAQRDQIQ